MIEEKIRVRMDHRWEGSERPDPVISMLGFQQGDQQVQSPPCSFPGPKTTEGEDALRTTEGHQLALPFDDVESSSPDARGRM